jgi:hypothetical protein
MGCGISNAASSNLLKAQALECISWCLGRNADSVPGQDCSSALLPSELRQTETAVRIQSCICTDNTLHSSLHMGNQILGCCHLRAKITGEVMALSSEQKKELNQRNRNTFTAFIHASSGMQ